MDEKYPFMTSKGSSMIICSSKHGFYLILDVLCIFRLKIPFFEQEMTIYGHKLQLLSMWSLWNTFLWQIIIILIPVRLFLLTKRQFWSKNVISSNKKCPIGQKLVNIGNNPLLFRIWSPLNTYLLLLQITHNVVLFCIYF